MKLVTVLASALLFMSLTACGGSEAEITEQAALTPPAAPQQAKTHMVTVPAGTVLTVALDTGLSSDTATVGMAFTATIVDSILSESRVVIPSGSRIEGKVTEAVAAKRGAGNGRLSLTFNTLLLPSGYRTGIVGSFQEITESKKGRNTGIIGGSAAGGALLGRILGKDTKGAVIGSIIGGGIGTAIVMGKEGMQATLPVDTPFEIKLEQSVQVPHEPSMS